jgi:zinc transport system substrate-binding protein
MLLLAGLAVEAKPLKVVTSFFPVYCFTTQVVGDLAQVDNLLPLGVGPHEFQFAPHDLRKLAEADLVVINGLQIESWLEAALKQAAAGRPRTVVTVSDGLADRLIHDGEDSPGAAGAEEKAPATAAGHLHRGGPNPHIWLDPQLAAHAVTNILTALQKADPEHATAYQTNARRYLDRLQKLDDDYRAALTPLKSVAFITYHQAFPYLTRRYGLNLVGVIELVPDVEPSPKYLARLSRLMREQKVKAIFTEPQYSNKLAVQLARDHQIQLGVLDTLETGPLQPSGYEESMRRNLDQLVKFLKP